MLMILEALQMQCYDAMRDLRAKIGVLQRVLMEAKLTEAEWCQTSVAPQICT